MRPFSLLFLIGILLSVCSCRSDFETVASTGDLTFSKDTIYLDTVFTNIGSSTYRLKVYNKSKNDITIPTIKLAKGLNSKYRMTVDGMQGSEGKSFKNVDLLAKDSLYIFIETTAKITDANPSDFLYTDQIEFDAGTNLQKVELVTLIQDAVFLYPKRFADGATETLPLGDEKIYGFYLDENDPVNGNELVFTNQKPYVIYGYAAVPTGKKVVFNSGSRVHFHAHIVINSAGLASLACSYGGNYKFTHSTFNNNWNSSSQVAVSIDNFITGAVPEVKDLTQATFNNCIIYGSYSNELSLSKKTTATFAYQFTLFSNYTK